MQVRIFGLLAAVTALIFGAGGLANAGGESHSSNHSQTQSFTASSSGTAVDIPLDLDGDSCTTTGTVTICTDTSGYANFAGTSSVGGDFTGQNVVEYDFVSGSGCNILGQSQPIAGCTLSGSSEQGCELQSVGGAEVDRNNATGDLVFSTLTATLCIDLSSGPPFNFTGSATATITGGTGNSAGASGTSTGNFHGQELVSDPAGHGFSWFVASSTGTITTSGK